MRYRSSDRECKGLGYQVSRASSTEGKTLNNAANSANVIVWALLSILCLTSPAFGQTAILMPMPYIQFSDQSGVPLSGGFVFTYAAGTSINQTTYTDSTEATANTDPIILNAGGEPSSPLGPGFFGGIYLTPSIGYRICVYNNLSVLQWCSDNVILSGGSAAGSSANDQVLYNCAGAICGSTGLTYNPGTQDLSVTMLSVSSGGSLNGIFTGSPSFSGTSTFNNIIVTNNATLNTVSFFTLTSGGCVNAAVSGVIRLCNGDAVNWRNSTNTADEGLTIGSSPADILIDSATNGLDLTGTSPNIYLGGTTVSFPAILPTGTTVQFKTGTSSAFVPVSALDYTSSGPFAIQGNENSTPATPATIPLAYFKTGHGWCAEETTGVEYCTPPTTNTTHYVAATVIVNSCGLASNGGEWNCAGTLSWGTTLPNTTYIPNCQISYPQPTGSYTVPAGYDAKVFFGTPTTTNIPYIINDDHSGSNGATYIMYCSAIE